jgi:outer membrane protein assembly factor BamB
MDAIKNFPKIFYKKISLPAEKSFSSNFLKLITSNIILLILFANLLLLTACEDEVIQPPPKPPGYQEDIPWPSLANSPWPMYRADPQNTGRSKFISCIGGSFDFKIDSLRNVTGVSVGLDSSIYFVAGVFQGNIEKSGLYCYTSDGNFKWMFKFPVYTYSISPLITSDGTIYVSSRIEKRLYAVTEKGKLKWELNDVRPSQTGINIGKDGTIYFLDDLSGIMTLTAVSSEGSIIWRLSNSDFSGDELDGMSFSPDGKVLYIPGWFNKQAIFAVDVETKSIKWDFGKNRVYLNGAPLVDSDGNIYVLSSDENANGFLYSLSSTGQVIWEYPLGSFGIVQNFNHFSMDKSGNIYLGLDTLYSISYKGKLNWKLKPSLLGGVSSPIICDAGSLIYLRWGGSEGNYLISVGLNGNLKWSFEEDQLAGLSSYSPALSYKDIFIPNFHINSIYVLN